MTIPFYQVTAFSRSVFGGNQACVMPMESWLSDDLLLHIAQENVVAETAYLKHLDQGVYALRWFTPDLEMDLCGHATLASAHVVLNHLEPQLDKVEFDTQSGRLVVTRSAHGLDMALPNRAPNSAQLPRALAESLNKPPLEVHLARDFMLVYASQQDVEQFDVDRALFDRTDLGTGGVIVTAPGEDCDFVSRFFTPQATILEDPVTGSAHCTLAPYWSERLGKTVMQARQLSARRGELRCEMKEDHVQVSGQATTYLEGTVHLNQT
ncbi:MAG: PhzF family phenazine biosynthesis protein [Flavobacteriales bacterium]